MRTYISTLYDTTKLYSPDEGAGAGNGNEPNKSGSAAADAGKPTWVTRNFDDRFLGKPLPTQEMRNPVQRGHRFQRKADSIPVIADST